MSARKKLNSAYVFGSLFTAGVFGVIGGSWLMFLIVLIVLLVFHRYEGNIRLDNDFKSPRS
jgi:hypothetical protein